MDIRELQQRLESPALQWWLGAALISLPLGVQIAFSLEARFFLDDAMIYLTYAKNLASGLGWTFNPGANDFATTSILQTAVHALLFRLFHDPANPDQILFALKIVEAAVVTLGVFLLYQVLTRSSVAPLYAAFAVAAFVSARHVATYHLFCGMETASYLALLCLAALLYSRSKLAALGIVTGLLYLVRPDAVLAGPAFALLDLAFTRDRGVAAWLRSWAIPGSIAAAIVVTVGGLFWLTKGSILPDSGEVKLLTAQNWGHYVTRLPHLLEEFLPWLGFAAVGCLSMKRERSALNALLAACFVSSALYALVGMPRAPWYYLPFNLMVFGFVGLGIQRVGDFLAARSWRPWPLLAALAALFLLVEGTGVQQVRINRGFFHWNARLLDASFGEASRWLAGRAEPNARVAAGSIGYVGYYADRHVIDMVGLVEPAIAREAAAGNAMYWYEVHHPEYVIRRLRYRNELGADRYRLLAVFGDPGNEPHLVGVFRRASDLEEDAVVDSPIDPVADLAAGHVPEP